VEEGDRVDEENDRDHDRKARQVALHDVRSALGGRREAHAAEAGVASRVQQHERDEREAHEHVPDGENRKHDAQDTVTSVDRDEARSRIQKLLVTGDNRLKQGVDTRKARESYEQALAVARDAGLEESVRPLVEIRLADLERLGRESPRAEPPEA
jgi:hypothetical protein